jgi:predicted DNA-binding protein (MmcQ/YjbR family)
MPRPTPEHAETALRARALAYPETREDFPWGESALKVRNKVFLFMRRDEAGLGLSVKLPHSADAALLLPFCEPTGYGLGKSGWVSARFGAKDAVPLEMLLEWLDESYRAVAPKTVVAKLAQPATGAPHKPAKAKAKRMTRRGRSK